MVGSLSPDGSGGFWVGYIAGGRGIYAPGGLVHVSNNGSHQAINTGLLDICPSVVAMALAPDGTQWVRLAGWNDYGANNHTGTCNVGVQSSDNRFIQSLGYLTANGQITILSADQMPPLAPSASYYNNSTLAVDKHLRPWIGTLDGVAVRNGDGSWESFRLWDAPAIAIALGNDQASIIAASTTGQVSQINADGTIVAMPALPEPPLAFAVDDRLWASTSTGVYQLVEQVWTKIYTSTSAPQILAQGSHLWIGDDQGLIRLASNGEQLLLKRQNSLIPAGRITSLAKFDNQRLLIGSEYGVAMLDTSLNMVIDTTKQIQAIDRLWQASNRNSAGTWVWGPNLWASQFEPYVQAPQGGRFVAYFDKTRMEVTRPDDNPNTQWYITNGLLVREMIMGMAQYSDDSSSNSCPHPVSLGEGLSCRANLRVVGDDSPDNQAPNYSDFASHLTATNARTGQTISQALLKADGAFEFSVVDQPTQALPETAISYFDQTTGHNIPQVFWQYLQQQPQDWLYMFGHPITEAYWTQALVGGQQQWVLVQMFERRTLSYTPNNPAEWRVEMGNVGQHYYTWRYRMQPWHQ
jgi:hypothetical protein